MVKVVVNTQRDGMFGYGLAAGRMMAAGGDPEAQEALRRYEIDLVQGGNGWGAVWTSPNPRRDDPLLVKAVEKLGERANWDDFSRLAVVEAPDRWRIVESCDGTEYVARSLGIKPWLLGATYLAALSAIVLFSR